MMHGQKNIKRQTIYIYQHNTEACSWKNFSVQKL